MQWILVRLRRRGGRQRIGSKITISALKLASGRAVETELPAGRDRHGQLPRSEILSPAQ
jgi:hypothetical protein